MQRLYYVPSEERLRACGIPVHKFNRMGQAVMRYANGWQVDEIADDMLIARGTVNEHLRKARDRTGVANACEMLLLLLGYREVETDE